MKYLYSAAVLFALISGGAQAQQVPVRSGDHPRFTRLTMPLETGQNWRAERTEREIRIILPQASEGFDTSSVFSRISQSRIATVAGDGDVLKMQIACDCDAAAFRNSGLLVIDIAERGTPLAGQVIAEGTGTPAPPNRTTAQKTFRTESSLPWIGRTSPFIDLQESPSTEKANVNSDREDTPSDRTAILDQVREDLTKRVATAASSGLLESSMQAPEVSPTSQENDTRRNTVEPRELPEAIKSPSLNMRITSSMDLPIRFGDSVGEITARGVSCPADGFLALEDWGDDRSFSAQLGPKRDALMDSRDHLNSGAAEDLAKLYLYFGFGAEALSSLQLDHEVASAHPELLTVGHILEYGKAPSFNPLAPYTDCDSDVALWATLSLQEIPTGTLIDTDAALRAVNNLPKHLRQIVAPALSAKLLIYGDADAAASAMRSVERIPEPPTPEAIMAQAEIAMDAGESASGLLEEVIETNTKQSPEALVELVKSKLAKDEPLPYEMATLVEAYAQELRGTEMGNKLRRTQIIALSQSQHFDEAFKALAALEPSLSPQASKDLRNTVLNQLSTKANDLNFLEHTFAQTDATLADLPNKTKLMLAARLMDLGFGAQVQSMIASIPDRPRTAERQLLAARAAIQLQQPFQAQAALIGIEDPVAPLLLAQAKEMVGDYREAYEILIENNAMDQAMQAAWLSDDWRDLTPPDTPEFGPVAVMAQPSQPDNDPLVGPLGRADRALEESAAARTTLEQLLNEPTVQVIPES